MARLAKQTDNTYIGLVDYAMELKGKAMTEGDYRMALSANQELAKLGGHYPADKVRIGGKVEVGHMAEPALVAFLACVKARGY